MRIDSFIVSVLIGILFLTGGQLFIVENMSNYNQTFDMQVFENITENQKNITDKSLLMKESSILDPISGDNAQDNLFKKAFTSIVLTYQFFKDSNSLISATAIAIGIPESIISIFTTIILIFAMFAIFYMIFRFMPRN